MIPVLEAVPNFSEGRDLDLIRALVDEMARPGVEVVDWSADVDHNRSVVTVFGDPGSVEDAAVAGAAFALEHIDLRRHAGVHPRVGALDVLPFIPLSGLEMDDAVRAAHRTGRRVAELGLPVYYYGAASERGRGLAEIRRGGFEALAGDVPPERTPDLPAGLGGRLHPRAGAVCVGARPLLLAWNVDVEGVSLDELTRVASDIRERGPANPGRFDGLRALAFRLGASDRLQISMNVERIDEVSPFAIFREIERRVQALGGRITGTEVIGLIPDPLVLPAATDRLSLLDPDSSRLLSARVARHVSRRVADAFERFRRTFLDAGDACPADVREAFARFSDTMTITPTSGDKP